MQNKKIINFLFVLLVLATPFFALADDNGTLNNTLDRIKTAAWQIAVAVAIIGWVIAGILFIVAQGAPEKVTTAKKAVIACLIGTILIIVAFSAVNIISGALGVSS